MIYGTCTHCNAAVLFARLSKTMTPFNEWVSREGERYVIASLDDRPTAYKVATGTGYAKHVCKSEETETENQEEMF